MKQKHQLYTTFTVLITIAALLLGSCQAATEIPIPVTDPPYVAPPLTEEPVVATNVPVDSGKPDLIQYLNNQQLLSSSGGALVWENSYQTLTEPGLGILSWLPLDISTPNFVLHTQFTWDSSDTGETACGVTFRDNSQGSYYLALVRKNGDGLLWLSLNNEWQVSPAESYGNFVKSGNNEVNDLVLIAEGPQITLLLNDAVLYQATDYSLNSGSISFITGTAMDGNTCTFQDSWIWEIGGSEVVQQAGNGSAEAHDLYAGFTGNDEIPFLILHKEGEQMGIQQEGDTTNVNGVVWTSPEGKSIVIFANDRGLPRQAVVDGYVIQYSNYTQTTVDITIIHPNGNREIFRAKLDTERMEQISDLFRPRFSLVSYLPHGPNRQDIGDIGIGLMKAGVYLADATICIGGIDLGLAATPLLLLMLDACKGFILTTVIETGKRLDLNVTKLEELDKNVSIGACHLSPLDCAGMIVNELEKLKEEADTTIANVPPPPAEPPKCNSKYNCN